MYDGYSWAKLPLVDKVQLAVGEEIRREWLWNGTLTCLESLTITVRTSDGQTFSSLVCMAEAPEPPKDAAAWATGHLLVTPEAQQRLCASEMWYHLGGWSDEGDTYDTQLAQFEEELEGFWARLIGPDEQLRRSLLTPLESLRPKWKSVTISSDGTVAIHFTDGPQKVIQPPVSQTPIQ